MKNSKKRYRNSKSLIEITRLLLYFKAIGKKPRIFLTLTFKNLNPFYMAQIKRMASSRLGRIIRLYKDRKAGFILICKEETKSKHYHYHIISDTIVWTQRIYQIWKSGYCHQDLIRSEKKAVQYLACKSQMDGVKYRMIWSYPTDVDDRTLLKEKLKGSDFII